MNGTESSFLDDWKGWDEIDTGDLQFNNVTLNQYTKEAMLCSLSKEQVESVECMFISNQSGYVEFYDGEGDVVYRRNVKFVFA